MNHTVFLLYPEFLFQSNDDGLSHGLGQNETELFQCTRVRSLGQRWFDRELSQQSRAHIRTQLNLCLAGLGLAYSGVADCAPSIDTRGPTFWPRGTLQAKDVQLAMLLYRTADCTETHSADARRG